MKEILVLAVAAALLVSLIGNDPSAQTVQTVKPGLTRFFATRVQGRLTVVPGAAASSALAGLSCSNISVDAISKDLKPHGPNEFGVPKWVRTAGATGTYASGKCDYSIPVPPNSAFYLSAGGHGEFDCDAIAVFLNTTGAALGPISVPSGTTRTVNATVTKILCEILY